MAVKHYDPGRNVATIVGSQELAPPEEVLKDEIGAIIFWLGRRVHDDEDLKRLHDWLDISGRFGRYPSFEIPEAAVVKQEPYPALCQFDRDFRRELSTITGPLAVFIITTSTVAEYPWVVQIDLGIQTVCQQHNRPPAFVYKIIFGPGFFKKGRIGGSS